MFAHEASFYCDIARLKPLNCCSSFYKVVLFFMILSYDGKRLATTGLKKPHL